MKVLFTYYTIILHNFLEINMNIWKVNSNDNTDDIDDKNDENDKDNNYTLRTDDEILKRAGQAKRNLIFHQYFP